MKVLSLLSRKMHITHKEMLSLTKILRDFQIPKSKEIFLKQLGKESQTTADEISACFTCSPGEGATASQSGSRLRQ
jgi:hypothetical protein